MDYDLVNDGEHRDLHIYNIHEWTEEKLIEAFNHVKQQDKTNRAKLIEQAIEDQLSVCLDLMCIQDLENYTDLTISVEEKLEAVKEYRITKGI